MFLQYLWGIETHILMLWMMMMMMVFTVPMRNWNEEEGKYVVEGKIVFTVPMRNWNADWKIGLQYQNDVFTVPMRNWNYCFFYAFLFLQYRFYSTYEELKLTDIGNKYPKQEKFLQYLWGIETRSYYIHWQKIT